MKRVVKKVWGTGEAVSPVIATILMVAITVVLAGVLVVYLQQIGQQGPGEIATPIGAISSKYQGNYSISINDGNYQVSDLKFMIKKPDGTVFVQGTMNSIKGLSLGGANNITYLDNNADLKVNPGDVIQVWGVDATPAGTITDSYTLTIIHTGKNKPVLSDLKMVPGG